ncbi:MAG TPA: lytic murein transglycosylase B [Porticoccaceae bacterium]|nr:lytic murein transglycosylase B [Porticoccaceae bacterium]HCO61766.1 lytic murein transglycosylase B [Porticoccaceae bacterium]
MVREHGFEAVDLQALLGEATYKQSIIDAMNRPAEKVKEWKDYREIFVTEKRLRQGIEFWQAQRATLERAEAEFGVPPQIVVAIIGVETYYGRITGSYRVIDALTTLAFDYPRRSKFFTRELENFLLLSREQGLNPLNLKGSYAGAMGFGQFMPSSYRAYAVDYNEDGVADIWTDPVDAIGSVANYFHRHGWRTGDEVAVRARIAGEYQPENINKVVKPYMDLSALADQGFTPVDESLSADTRAIPLKLQGRKGVEFWLGLHNFYVITRYNTSFRYAMAVNQLSEKLLEQMANAAP